MQDYYNIDFYTLFDQQHLLVIDIYGCLHLDVVFGVNDFRMEEI